VASTETATTQAEIDTYARQKVNHDARAASRLHRSLLATSSTPTGGVVQAYAGYDGPHCALDFFYPSKIVLRKGQRVQWHFDKLAFEDHTVTFPGKKALRIAINSGVPVCDPDGDAGTIPDQPADIDATTLATVCPGGHEHPRLRELRGRRRERRNHGSVHPSFRRKDGGRAVYVPLHDPALHAGGGGRLTGSEGRNKRTSWARSVPRRSVFYDARAPASIRRSRRAPQPR